MDNEEKIEGYKERFVRWQQLTATQLSNTNNLIFTLTLGLIAFSVSKTDLKFPTDFYLLLGFIAGYFLLLTSILTGLLLTFNRLNDFRKTKDIIKYKRQRFETRNKIKNHGNIETISSTIDNLSNQTDKLERCL